ncbi:MAG TPA: chromosomal replication initiator protein DnaA [Phycisphaerae bacterium]|nr:chromosomal replication initiator protein DnaA [Phycisphaerae bacterium]
MSVVAHPEKELSAQDQRCAQIHGQLQQRIGAARYAQWFDGKTRWSIEQNALKIQTAGAFTAGWIRTRFFEDLRRASELVVGPEVQITVEASPEMAAALPPQAPEAPAAMVVRPKFSSGGNCLLGEGYLLEDFVCGPCNHMAYRLAVQTAEQTQRQFNPLFIHGGCGLGKTHLLQGVCHRFGSLHKNRRWIYLTAEQFTNDFLEAMKRNAMSALRRRLRQADLLVIDDVHFFSRKACTQEELLHTFNELDGTGRQVVLACDSPPKDISDMTETLRSRFLSGMVVRVDPPDVPTRLEILRRYAQRRRWQVSDITLAQLAQAPAASVRELEGLLLQVAAGAHLTGGATTGESVLKQLHDRLGYSRLVAIDHIITVVAEYFQMEPAAIIGAGRERSAATARGIAMYLARQHSQMSYPDIGRAMGKRTHSTAIGACQRVEAQLAQGELIRWDASDGPKQQCINEVLQNITARLRHRRR